MKDTVQHVRNSMKGIQSSRIKNLAPERNPSLFEPNLPILNYVLQQFYFVIATAYPEHSLLLCILGLASCELFTLESKER